MWNHLFQQQSKREAFRRTTSQKTGIENVKEQRSKCWWFLPRQFRHASPVHIHCCTRAKAKMTQHCASGTVLPHRSGRSRTAASRAAGLCPHLSKHEQQGIIEEMFWGEGRPPLTPVPGSASDDFCSKTVHNSSCGKIHSIAKSNNHISQ